MYKMLRRGETFHLNKDKSISLNSVATLADEYGGRCQVVVDDHCYVLYLKHGNIYKMMTHIFPEAYECLKQLPSPK